MSEPAARGIRLAARAGLAGAVGLIVVACGSGATGGGGGHAVPCAGTSTSHCAHLTVRVTGTPRRGAVTTIVIRGRHGVVAASRLRSGAPRAPLSLDPGPATLVATVGAARCHAAIRPGRDARLTATIAVRGARCTISGSATGASD